MVSTRHHPRQYPLPETPSKDSLDEAPSTTSRSTRSTRGKSLSRKSIAADTFEEPSTLEKAVVKSRGRTRTSASSSGRVWTHTPSHVTIIWLLASIPLVIWDTFYVLGRPHTFPGGWMHSPIWSPYAIYYNVDYMYGQPAWDQSNGLTSAQGLLNVVETAIYIVYLYIVYKHGEEQKEQGKKVEGRGSPSTAIVGWFGLARIVRENAAGAATLLGFSASLMTLSKTILYWLNEACSGFNSVGHNSWSDLVLLWIIPNGLWIVFPIYMCWVFGAEILEGLAIASGASVPEAVATKKEE